MTLVYAQAALRQYSDPTRAVNFRKFFKNSKDDVFLGASTICIRKVAKEFYTLPLSDVLALMISSVHDEKSLANAILCLKFLKGAEHEQTKIFNFYIKHRNNIRDWDGVDSSAPYIVGPYLLEREKKLLYDLAISKNIWDRRIAIVSTLFFIRNNRVDETLKIAQMLLQDTEDLIHKATGWMLREVGKRDLSALKNFLEVHHTVMPRTMLRYAIERFDPVERMKYVKQKRNA